MRDFVYLGDVKEGGLDSKPQRLKVVQRYENSTRIFDSMILL